MNWMNLGFGNFDFKFMIGFRCPLGMSNERLGGGGGLMIYGDGMIVVAQEGEEKRVSGRTERVETQKRHMAWGRRDVEV